MIEIYRNANILACWTNSKLRLGKLLPVVVEAPEPSTILWENLSHTQFSRFLRKSATVMTGFFLIFISLVVVFISKYVEYRALDDQYSFECPVSFDSWTETQQEVYVQENPDYLHCYCDQFSMVEQVDNDLCENYAEDIINSQILQFCAALIVVFVNTGLEFLVERNANFEKHHTHDDRNASIFFMLFALKYINTAAVFFINGNNYFLNLFFDAKNGSTKEFTSEWFNTVGLTIILVQIGDIFFSHSDATLKYIKYVRSLKHAAKDPTYCLTQDDLNKLFCGPDFEIAYSYAQLMCTLFVCLTFSLGIPILYPIVALNFVLYYFIEKFYFINMYKIPPHFNSVLGKVVTQLIPFAFVVHLAMSIWVISTEEIFANSESAESSSASEINDQIDAGLSFKSRLFGKNTFPLTVIMFFVIFYLLVYFSSRGIYISCKKRFPTLFSSEERQKEIEAKALVSYQRAVERNLIKSLPTYNILQNPVYKEAFSITWSFAVQNKTVRSVRTMKKRAAQPSKEDDAQSVDASLRNAAAKGRGRQTNSMNSSFYKSYVKKFMET